MINEGMTCYINCLLQALFSIGSFRSIVYNMTEASQEEPPRDDSAAEAPADESILKSLQRVFFNL